MMTVLRIIFFLSLFARSSLACPGTAPVFAKDFEARSSIADRGKLYEWTYHASSRLHETEFFGQAQAIEVTVLAPMAAVRQLWFDVPSCRVAVVSGNAVVTYHNLDKAYQATLAKMIEELNRMRELDARNEKLASLIEYLQQF
jgi:hypothetical protein